MTRHRSAITLPTHAPDSTFAESFRSLRTNLLLRADADGLRSIAVTSAERGEGKSVTSANLARSLARDGRRTLLLDADLRVPCQHTVFGVDRGDHSCDLDELEALLDSATPREAIDERIVSVEPDLDLLPAGAAVGNPAEVLGSAAYHALLDELLAMYEMVVVDTPPIGRVTDAAIVGRLVDSVLLVVDYQGNRRRQSRRAVQTLQRLDAPLLGTVVNRYDGEQLRSYGTAYGRAYAAAR
jgi:capsular exopolysaccharide synthesis family protein